jgi:putative FmdB family regulatory protein
MPIYAYRCEACGFAKDVLQKISDAQLTECPSCGKSTFKKQVTAAGFQLKGTGWYATDFRGSGSAPAAPAPATSSAPATEAAKPAAESAAPATPAATTTPPSV